MQPSLRAVSCRFLDDLILLLDEERETRGCRDRGALGTAVSDLRTDASRSGASEMTVGLIRAVEATLADGRAAGAVSRP